MSLIDVATQRIGMPYRISPPPDGVNNVDCSLYVVLTFRDAGQPLPPGVRTAEQIRQACTPVAWNDVRPGDLLFFEHTYEPGTPPAADGYVASHIGISFGKGTFRMYDAHSADDSGRPGVGITDISTSYWRPKLFEARRYLGKSAEPAPTGMTMRVVNTEGHGLNIREQPDAGSRKLGNLPEGTVVDVGEYTWRRVRVRGIDGWAAAEYLAR